MSLCRALAKNCAASINAKDGNEAKDWKKGNPVRVVRSAKGRKHSNYAPLEGNRYDGLYKVGRLRLGGPLWSPLGFQLVIDTSRL